MGELLIGIALIVISIVIYTQGGNFPQFGEVHLNAGSFPRLIVVLMGSLSFIMVILRLKAILSQRKENGKIDIIPNFKNLFTEYKLVIITLASLFIYTFSMKYIGFLLSTFLFIVGNSLLIGPKSKKDLVLVSVIALSITFGSYYLFQNLLHVRFPRGMF